MSRIVCFIDKETGESATCSMEAAGHNEIDCSKCDFPNKYKGKEKEHFIYWVWDDRESFEQWWERCFAWTVTEDDNNTSQEVIACTKEIAQLAWNEGYGKGQRNMLKTIGIPE